jgi:hypothetical protein
MHDLVFVMQDIDRDPHKRRYSTLLQFVLDKSFSKPSFVRGHGRFETKGCEVNEWLKGMEGRFGIRGRDGTVIFLFPDCCC